MSHAPKYVWQIDDDDNELKQESSGAGEFVQTEEVDDRPAIVRLAHAWLNERGSPDILPWPAEIVDTVMDQLQQQQAILDSLMMDTSTSEEEHFRLNLVQLDADRAKWLLRSFLRARLVKLEKYAMYISKNQSEHTRLSDLELGYVKRYEQLMSEHFQSTVLQFLPEPMRGLDDPPPGGASSTPGGMITAPRLDEPVFLYCRRDGGMLPMPDGASIPLLPGTVHVIPYRAAEPLLLRGHAELL